MKDFLPKNYQDPITDKYMKFVEGENKFRILDSAIVGTEGWSENKPVRWRLIDDPPDVVWDKNRDGTARKLKRFWAFPVWNYRASGSETKDHKVIYKGAVQILEITQVTIQRVINALTKNPKWGSPFNYDINVIRTGEGFDTEYSVTPDPKEPIDKKIVGEYKKMDINLEALFEGKDPFASSEEIDPDDIPL